MPLAKPAQDDLFESDVFRKAKEHRLAELEWPTPERFPLNLPGQDRSVRKQLVADLATSQDTLIVTGYASMEEVVQLLVRHATQTNGVVRLLFGTEPFQRELRPRKSKARDFPSEVREYWLNLGISLHASADVIVAIDLLKAGRVQARHAGTSGRPLHAKIFKTDKAVMAGSSNLTWNGLSYQLELNCRFESSEKKRYAEVCTVAENYWAIGEDYTADLIELLGQLLKVVSWRDALARAASELLEGDWADTYTRSARGAADTPLWPSQRQGIAQALWVIENVGSVLIADATGSGKTRMGAHLLRALWDRSWSRGGVRGDLSVMISPPSVLANWNREAQGCGYQLTLISHGILSRSSSDAFESATRGVRRAQTLAIDEAHNFLNLQSRRTQQALASIADNVVLFTATPINRSSSDLISLVNMLGADNLEDDALEVLKRLARRQRDFEGSIPKEELAALKQEIQRFTVRRTKVMFNELVDRDPPSYCDGDGRMCRYPRHASQIYETGETAEDQRLALAIAAATDELKGLALLEGDITMSEIQKREGWTEDRFVRSRLGAAPHLAKYHVLSNLRSSRAALLEHLCGSRLAAKHFKLQEDFKSTNTGNVLQKLKDRKDVGPPTWCVAMPPPDWLASPEAYGAACDAERAIYRRIRDLTLQISDARESAKVQKLIELIGSHRSIIAFDSTPISLEVFLEALKKHQPGLNILVATGSRIAGKKAVQRDLARNSDVQAIALCSDSMSEGINLQGASAIIHLDMPSVVRIAEQRVGRVDRMDSPHAAIEAWWPNDSPAFAIRSDRRFFLRHQTVESLLGSNLELPPEFTDTGQPAISTLEIIEETERALEQPWDGITDAFSPVRDLVLGPRALIVRDLYEHYVGVDSRVLARISIVKSQEAWAFFASKGGPSNSPKWILLVRGRRPQVLNRLDDVATALRARLGDVVEDLPMDSVASEHLRVFLKQLADAERTLLPRRKQRALLQMKKILTEYQHDAERQRDLDARDRWAALYALCEPGEDDLRFDLDAVAQAWLEAIRGRWFDKLKEPRRRRTPLMLRHLDADLLQRPLTLAELEHHFDELPAARSLDRTVAACILGVTGD